MQERSRSVRGQEQGSGLTGPPWDRAKERRKLSILGLRHRKSSSPGPKTAWEEAGSA